jgi:hypothetical protein
MGHHIRLQTVARRVHAPVFDMLCEQCRPRHSPIESVRASRQPSRSSAGPIIAGPIIIETRSAQLTKTHAQRTKRDAHSQRPHRKGGRCVVGRWASGVDQIWDWRRRRALSVVRSCVCVVANGACGRGVEWTHKRCVVLDRTIGEAWVRQQIGCSGGRWSVVGSVWSLVSVSDRWWSVVGPS